MNIKQKLKNITITVVASLGIMMIFPLVTFAATPTSPGNNGCGVDTTIIKCDNVNITSGGTTNNGVWSLLLTAINILTAGVGIAAVGGIVYGSILYTSAGGNQDQTKKAIEFIRNVIIGIIAYALMFSALNFIVPGGLFN